MQAVVDEAVDESGLGNLTSRSATNAVVAIVESMQPDDEYGRDQDIETGIRPQAQKKAPKREGICKRGFINFITSTSVVLASIFGYNYYLKH
jgi:hypothetical protein